MNQLPAMPRYRTPNGRVYTTLQEAAKALGEVTVWPDYKLVRRPGASDEEHAYRSAVYRARAEDLDNGGYARQTLFDEIVVMPEHDGLCDMHARPSGTKTADVGPLAEKAVDALRTHLREHWAQDRPHVMMFSSGYDSRLLGALLRQLVDDLGESWLGELRCHTFEPEIEYARRVFDAIGLPATFDPVEGDPVDYYASCLDFEEIGRTFSDTERFWGGPLLVQQRKLGGVDKAQGVSAIFSDETLKWNRKQWGTVGWFLSCYLFDQPGVFPGRPDISFVTPFGGRAWLELLTEYYVPCSIDDFKLAMLRHAAPRLADTDALPNFRFQVGPMRERNGGFIDQQRLSRATTAAMEDAYAASWYAQGDGVPRQLDFSGNVLRYLDEGTRHYIAAAICEHLRSEGVELVR